MIDSVQMKDETPAETEIVHKLESDLAKLDNFLKTNKKIKQKLQKFIN